MGVQGVFNPSSSARATAWTTVKRRSARLRKVGVDLLAVEPVKAIPQAVSPSQKKGCPDSVTRNRWFVADLEWEAGWRLRR